MNWFNKLVIFSTLIIFTSNINATGESGAQFLKIGIGARACAMGGAYTGIADDATSIYWNPAGLTQIDNFELSAMQHFWLLDMSYQNLSAVLPSKYGDFGMSISYSSSGEIPNYENFEKLGTYTAYDMAVTLAYSK